jgi:hypothetical protein
LECGGSTPLSFVLSVFLFAVFRFASAGGICDPKKKINKKTRRRAAALHSAKQKMRMATIFRLVVCHTNGRIGE